MRSRRFRMLTGVVTVAVFATIGFVLGSEGRWEVGGPVLALAALRAGFVARDLYYAMTPEPDED